MGIGQSHLLSWSEVEGASATVFAELDDAKRTKGEADWAIPGVVSLDDLLAAADDPASPHHVDVIDLCTPPWLHEEQIVRCLDAGVHVICEKPLVDSVVACDRIAATVDAAAATSGARFMPIFQYRFGDGAARARALIDAGITGRLFTASASTWWRRGRAYYADAPWRGTWHGERGGCVLSHAIHNHDLLTWMSGPLVELRAMTATRVNDVETEDCAVAIGRTADGGLVTMNVTLGAASESSQLVWHFDNVTITSSSEAYDPAAGPWNFEFRRSAFAEEAEQVWADLAPSGSQYTGQFQRFVDALSFDKEFPVTLADARASLELVTAWYHSAAHGVGRSAPARRGPSGARIMDRRRNELKVFGPARGGGWWSTHMTAPAFSERVTSVSQLHGLRNNAARWLSDADADEDSIDTVALVLSETCTNALTHGGADDVDVEITIDNGAPGDTSLITVCTRHDDNDFATLALPTTMPAPVAPCGRGLAIVDRLVDGMTLRIDPPHVIRKCWLRTARAGGESSTR